jgi:hypothetical protein
MHRCVWLPRGAQRCVKIARHADVRILTKREAELRAKLTSCLGEAMHEVLTYGHGLGRRSRGLTPHTPAPPCLRAHRSRTQAQLAEDCVGARAAGVVGLDSLGKARAHLARAIEMTVRCRGPTAQTAVGHFVYSP